MKNDVGLGVFITFILLAAVPQKPSVAVSDFIPIQPTAPRLLPFTTLLKIALDRVRAHESSKAILPTNAGLIFRFGRTEQSFDHGNEKERHSF